MKHVRLYDVRGIYAVIAALLIGLFAPIPVYALHPLITDDAVMQGKGVFELELNYQFSHDRYSEIAREPKEVTESGLEGQSVFGKRHVRENVHQAGVGLAYGVIDAVDIAFAVPFQSVYYRNRHFYYTGPLQGLYMKQTEMENGLGDISAEVKWKIFEYKALSLALKPGIIIPTGNCSKGLGAGKFGAYGYFITTLDLKMVLLHLNIGYIRNQNRINEREDIWHASLAGEFWVVKDRFRLVANIGLDRNKDKRSRIHDAYLLGGGILTVSDSCDLDLGFKYSIQSKQWESPGPDYSILAGATIWFGYVPKSGAEVNVKEGEK
ncbi:MAG: transporter [Spirochaetes bacterium]|nr:transporter [Spirochaetota bacterium]